MSVLDQTLLVARRPSWLLDIISEVGSLNPNDSNYKLSLINTNYGRDLDQIKERAQFLNFEHEMLFVNNGSIIGDEV